ncbi:uncharacterized protein LOC144097824 [Amblyomma americanum]
MMEASTDSLLSVPGTSSAGSRSDETSMPPSEPAAENETAPSEPRAKKAKASRAPRRHLVPRLRSCRGRNLKMTVRFKSEVLKDDDTNWTVNERKQLLDALKEHGSSDLEKLAQAVPPRSATAVKDVPAASSVQECFASGMPCAPKASTSEIVASSFCLASTPKRDNASPAVHLETHFLMCEPFSDGAPVQERSHLMQGATGRRTTQALRILRRALDVKRRRFDRSQALVKVVESCQRQPFADPTEDYGLELPQFADIYQMLQDVMENKVPAALGPCEQFVVRRLLGTLTTAVASLDLNEEREVLKQQLAWAAAQPLMTTVMTTAKDTETPTLETGEKTTMNFPSMSVRKENLKNSWNPLRLPAEIIQKPWPIINELMSRNVFRSERATGQGESAPLTPARAGGSRREPQPLETFNAWKH